MVVDEWMARLRDRGTGSSGALVRDALTPVLPEWLEGVCGGFTFRATQLVTGHSSFGAYLQDWSGRDPRLPALRDSAWHTLGECPEWASERDCLRGVFGRDLRVASVLRAAASSPNKWGAFLRNA